MNSETKSFIEYWNEDFFTRSIDPIPDSMMPQVRASLEEDVERLAWGTDWLIDDLERKLHRLNTGDPLLILARAAIAAERTARAAEGPVEHAGRRAMSDIYNKSTIEVAERLDEIRSSLAALMPDSPVRLEGEKRLAHRLPLLEMLRERLAHGEPPWREPESGQPLQIGDGFSLEGEGEHHHYAITAASPGHDGEPNFLLAALGRIAARANPAPPTPLATVHGGPSPPKRVSEEIANDSPGSTKPADG